MFHLGRLAQRSANEQIKFEFGIADTVGNSLIGQARDIIVERALAWNADYVFFFDDDMMFADDCFVRLFNHQKPFVGALAFTSREPISPVLYKFRRSYSFDEVRIDVEPILDYPRDRLFQVDAIGTGVVLISTDVFKKLGGPPWFNGSISMGEDIYLCYKMEKAGIPIYCDSSVKTLHAPNEPLKWHGEQYYLESKDKAYRFHDNRQATYHSNPQLSELSAVG